MSLKLFLVRLVPIAIRTNQMNYLLCIKKASHFYEASVIPFGFEPKTYCLEGSCSIQLSYGTKFYF